MLLIRCNATYHVTTLWEIQTVEWMSYSGSSHFSDKLSYKILFISSCRLKDMGINRFEGHKNKQRHADIFFRLMAETKLEHVKLNWTDQDWNWNWQKVGTFWVQGTRTWLSGKWQNEKQQRLGFGSRITVQDKNNYRNFVWLNKQV
jgi:hypothetical protein